jgi:large-conductance mechanosensitive channel
LGIAMLVISVYPLILKPDFIKKSHGAIIGFVGLIFLARGFVDLNNAITNIYDVVFVYYDFPIAVIALVLILFVIYHILKSAREYQNEFSRIKGETSKEKPSKEKAKKSDSRKKGNTFDYEEKMRSIHENKQKVHKSKQDSQVSFNDKLDDTNNNFGINESTNKIHFESNDLLDDYKK